ncbi:MAG: uracil-DNA glycosylase family protein, partial [Spirochaetota bacterium]
MSNELKVLLNKIETQAEKLDMPIDTDIYNSCGKNPNKPILYAGSLEADTGFLARDLGKSEVIKGEPLIGSGGNLLRKTIYSYHTGKEAPKNEVYFKDIMKDVLFTNLVPYKPIGNKVFSKKIRRQFAPYIAELLINHWKGKFLITLGTEAFKWFENFCDKKEIEVFWKDEEKRYTETFQCKIFILDNDKSQSKDINIAPLPHPSPLNVKWYKRFPELLKNRLNQ